MMKQAGLALAFSLFAGAAAHAGDPVAAASAAAVAAEKIGADGLLRHIAVLSSDRFEGRLPATRGEKLTVAYIEKAFRKLGLAPGNPDGSFEQHVPMTVTQSSPSLSIEVGGKSVALRYPDDYVAASFITRPEVKIDRSEMVFVGYGVQAPEYGWDDFKGVDVRGKTLVMLVNDPPIPDPEDPSQLDPAMFGGKAMTYYGRWTYKYEIAARLGAAAALIVHETKPASYPWDVVMSGFTTPRFSIDSAEGNRNHPPVPGWLHLDAARTLFKAAGLDYDALKQAALSKDFRPVSLGAFANFTIANRWKKVETSNVLGRIEGSDPVLRNEYVIYTAHWDHLGIDNRSPGPRHERIYHGAVDNASGVASLIELARAYKALPAAPRRTILFMATTAEEKNLLGAQYYATHPLYPLDRTLVDINIDTINTWGRTEDVQICGKGKSTTDEIVAKAAAAQGRTTVGEQRPEIGWFYRGDQFEFAKAGVPVVYATSGSRYIGKSPEFARSKAEDYTAHHYHKVADVISKDWDLSGAVEDIRMLFHVGHDIAQGASWPQWKDGAEFKAARDAMLAKKSGG
jgi:Zn-dependent M28 family amino/carboxypeptidase